MNRQKADYFRRYIISKHETETLIKRLELLKRMHHRSFIYGDLKSEKKYNHLWKIIVKELRDREIMPYSAWLAKGKDWD